MSRQSHCKLTLTRRVVADIIPPTEYPEYVHSFPSRGPQAAEMFDYPGFAARLFAIAQAAHLPHEFMTFVVQTAELEQWKSMQDASGTLSYRELARRGKAIERMLLGQAASGPARYVYSCPIFVESHIDHLY